MTFSRLEIGVFKTDLKILRIISQTGEEMLDDQEDDGRIVSWDGTG
jgi:hypothetical protein